MADYRTNLDLPDRIRYTHTIPEQDIYRLAYNNAFAASGDLIQANEAARRAVETYRSGLMAEGTLG